MDGKKLKWIALFAMMLDHFAAAVVYAMAKCAGGRYTDFSFSVPTDALIIFINNIGFEKLSNVYYILRYIGRIAFPIYILLLVEGFMHTSNIKKYVLSIGILAIISEIPFDLALFDSQLFYWEAQNVFVTLFIGLICLFMMHWTLNHFSYDDTFRYILITLQIGACCCIAQFVLCDYKWGGVLAIAVAFLIRKIDVRERNLKLTWIFMFLGACTILTIYAGNEWYAFLALPIITFYNGQRGHIKYKYFYYFMYPLHLIIIAIIMKVTGLCYIS